ncbi:MAG: T9SS type A sorting domain-containing protein [Bacteroidales bacterium]|nr:T9SS type A sorting domain-containing protein [Bacteroidales bacterium]
MPLGNSITQGYTDGTLLENQRKGYRKDLKQLLQTAGFVIDFVGSQTSGEAYFSDAQHAGIGGSRDQYVARLLTDGYDERNGVQILVPPRPYLDDYDPDIVLLHIGTNDVTHEGEEEVYLNQKVSYILDLIDQYEVRSGREVIVFLALIINRKKPWIAGSGAYTTSVFNDHIEAMALDRIAAGDKLIIVDMENDAGFLYDNTDMADDGQGLHPNAAGYMKMANLWFSSIIDNYNTAPVLTPIPDQTLDEGGTSNAILLDNYITDLQDADQNIGWTYTQPGTPRLNITIDADRRATATPLDEDWYGTQTVVFTATDQGKNGKYIKSAADTVVYTITAVNDAPVFTSNPVLTLHKGELFAYTFLATDVDAGDILQYSLIENPAWLKLYTDSKLLAGIPQQAGDFLVILRVSDGQTGTDQSFTIHVDGPTPIVETEIKDAVRLYPNPASDYFLVSLAPKLAGIIDFRLYDIHGELIFHSYLNCKEEIMIRIENIPSGLYFYKVISEKVAYTGKLLIGE